MKSHSSWNLMLTSVITILAYSFWYSIITYHPNVTRPIKENPKPEAKNFYIREHGEYWILYNYIAGTKIGLVDKESITFTTHAEHSDLGDLVRQAYAWKGAVSVAIYATGTDFVELLETIHYLYDCTDKGKYVQLYVSIHVILHKSHMPNYIPKQSQLFKFNAECKANAAKRYNKVKSYRALNNLLYPTNMLRNVARIAAQTYHVFPLDLSVYPSPKFIIKFQRMQRSMWKELSSKSIYCFPLFRLRTQRHFSLTKPELVSFVARGLAKPVAQATNMLPELTAWLNFPSHNRMEILATLHDPIEWDPYCVGANDEMPLYDERVNGRNLNFDLMLRLGFHIHIMDGAFLIQKPSTNIIQEEAEVEAINIQYLNELLVLYGDLKEGKGTETQPKFE